MLLYGLGRNMPQGWQILQIASSGCSPVVQLEKDLSDYCTYSNWFAMQAIQKAQPDVVIVGQRNGHNTEHMAAIAQELQKLGVKRVVFTGPSPHWRYDLPKIVLRKFWAATPQRTFVGVEQKVIEADKKLRANLVQNGAVRFVSIIDSFCNDEGCLIYLGEDKKTGVTSWDYGHLTPVASDFFASDALVEAITGAPTKDR
jgi:hypothetical protein